MYKNQGLIFSIKKKQKQTATHPSTIAINSTNTWKVHISHLRYEDTEKKSKKLERLGLGM